MPNGSAWLDAELLKVSLIHLRIFAPFKEDGGVYWVLEKSLRTKFIDVQQYDRLLEKYQNHHIKMLCEESFIITNIYYNK